MARKKELSAETSQKTFPVRLRRLMDERNVNQPQLADAIGVRRQTISNYANGQSSPDWETLVKISLFFNVSSDYLLGLSSADTDDRDERYICEYTGLSKSTINKLHKFSFLSEGNNVLSLFDSFICQFYARFLHQLMTLNETVETVKDGLKAFKSDPEGYGSVNVEYSVLQDRLHRFYEFSRRIPIELFHSDELYDELSDLSTIRHIGPSEKDIEFFLLEEYQKVISPDKEENKE